MELRFNVLSYNLVSKIVTSFFFVVGALVKLENQSKLGYKPQYW